MRKTETFFAVVCLCLAYTGCGVSGNWEAGNGAASVTLKSGKAQRSPTSSLRTTAMAA